MIPLGLVQVVTVVACVEFGLPAIMKICCLKLWTQSSTTEDQVLV